MYLKNTGHLGFYHTIVSQRHLSRVLHIQGSFVSGEYFLHTMQMRGIPRCLDTVCKYLM